MIGLIYQHDGLCVTRNGLCRQRINERESINQLMTKKSEYCYWYRRYKGVLYFERLYTQYEGLKSELSGFAGRVTYSTVVEAKTFVFFCS